MAEQIKNVGFLITNPLEQPNVVEHVPNGIDMIDIDDIPYRAEPQVRCAFCTQRQHHRDGYFAVLSDGTRAPCGNCCAANFDAVKKQTIDRSRNHLKREHDARQRAIKLKVDIDELRVALQFISEIESQTSVAKLILADLFSPGAIVSLEAMSIKGLGFLDQSSSMLSSAEATVRQIERLDSATHAEFEVFEERRKRSWEEVRRGISLAVAGEQFFAHDNLAAISEWTNANGPTFGIREFKVRVDKVCPKGPGEWRNFTIPRIEVPEHLRKYLPQ
ncbi:hypothetical protein SAMN05444149_101637 [Pseudosulfitobacter pseudonitzschiae]|uniref:Uncharacterized protein n=1 Tax=Pseudosulfitobacter pseudonitzschiae TaxID=1402135 RepID=A0A073J6U6_9RHOB|nr:hypothetical protein [Pseudosulfitobacter pseudonitzschiae]KEJ97674.1 hypothetical protein SUH3_01430 [Pseudosulfitobacter pseudonitzschiae]QKS08947.1 hypothetical protein HT745_10910 [Pseudosulfitobacter pseudonitzschiae]SHE62416.1 hypothetical protein SAMN05444149_101637 [Pseudosulfitobacter pseudonitzschiae]